jgi:hypothetical protein
MDKIKFTLGKFSFPVFLQPTVQESLFPVIESVKCFFALVYLHFAFNKCGIKFLSVRFIDISNLPSSLQIDSS